MGLPYMAFTEFLNFLQALPLTVTVNLSDDF